MAGSARVHRCSKSPPDLSLPFAPIRISGPLLPNSVHQPVAHFVIYCASIEYASGTLFFLSGTFLWGKFPSFSGFLRRLFAIFCLQPTSTFINEEIIILTHCETDVLTPQSCRYQVNIPPLLVNPRTLRGLVSPYRGDA